jgi:hypothetical protein
VKNDAVESWGSVAAVIQSLLSVPAACVMLTSRLRRRVAALHRELNRTVDEKLAD